LRSNKPVGLQEYLDCLILRECLGFLESAAVATISSMRCHHPGLGDSRIRDDMPRVGSYSGSPNRRPQSFAALPGYAVQARWYCSGKGPDL
jgi:hypothetical protein